MNTPGYIETIVAIATPPGTGGVGIVRISGPHVMEIARTLLGRLPKPRYATHLKFHAASGETLDDGIALYFPAPHSFTGEDVLELQGHGGPVVQDMILQQILLQGARLARPGEFSERAYLNGKIDLVQAEAVADLIESVSTEAARAALNSLQGVFSRRVRSINEDLVQLRVQIEASLDFPEEEIDVVHSPRLVEQCRRLLQSLSMLRRDSHQGRLLHDGMTVVLAGRPNAGKSSLLNRLSEDDRAIVSATPGTTRDVLKERIQIDGLPLHVLDTAGLRSEGDEIENEGMRRAHMAMDGSDRILLVVDDAKTDAGELVELLNELSERARVTVIRNKIDISGRPPGYVEKGDAGLPEIALSALNGDGIESLRNHLKTCMGFQSTGGGNFTARRRHIESIDRALFHVEAGELDLRGGRGELAAESLRRAQQALGEITGEFTSDDLLGRIFSEFCIGK